VTFNGSYRWTDYESYGSDSTYKVSLNWQFIDALRLRGAYGTSFRAPALYELYLANQTGFIGQGSVDPCIQWNLSSNQQIVKNCGPSGIGLPENWNNVNSSALSITGGGAGILEAETSDNTTVGLIWTPESLPEVSASRMPAPPPVMDNAEEFTLFQFSGRPMPLGPQFLTICWFELRFHWMQGSTEP